MTAVRVHSKIFLNNLMLNNSKSSYIISPQKCLSNHPLTRSFQTNVDNQNYPITVPMTFSGDLTQNYFCTIFISTPFYKICLPNVSLILEWKCLNKLVLYFYLDHFKTPKGKRLANSSVDVPSNVTFNSLFSDLEISISS